MSEEQPSTDGPSETPPADPAETPADPAEHTTDSRSISPRVRYIWGFWTLVSVAVLAAIASAIAFVVGPVPVLVGPVVGLLGVVLGLAWVYRRHQVWTYEVRPDSLYLERGVVTHVRTIAPFVRIQHVDTQRGPAERWLGLSTLVVYTAGSRGADVAIPGLTPEEARDLQQRVKELAIEAEGGDAV